MDLTKLSDLDLAKLLSEQQDVLSQSAMNVKLLKDELAKRISAKPKEEKAG